MRPSKDGSSKALWACLRRISKKRALTKIMTSDNPALEGRLRAFEVIREDKPLAKTIDKLLNPKRLPWFMRRAGATCGWVDGKQRALIADGLRRVKGALTPELAAFANAIDEADGDVIVHDGI